MSLQLVVQGSPQGPAHQVLPRLGVRVGNADQGPLTCISVISYGNSLSLKRNLKKDRDMRKCYMEERRNTILQI